METLLRKINERSAFENPNILINGGFDFWYRGTSMTLSGTAGTGYLADRWCHGQGGSGPVFDYGLNADVPNSSFINSMEIKQTSVGPNNSGFIAQRIESILARRLVGKEVTLSFWVKSTKSNIDIYAYYPNATDAYTSAQAYSDVQFYSASKAITLNEWTYVYTTFTVPAEGSRGIAVAISSPTQTAFQYARITGVKLEVGRVATPFTFAGESYSAEQLLCHRYFYKVTGGRVQPMAFGYTNGTGITALYLPLPVEMRSNVPAVTFDSYLQFKIIAGGAGAVLTGQPLTSTAYRVSYGPAVGFYVPHGALTANHSAVLAGINDLAVVINVNAEL